MVNLKNIPTVLRIDPPRGIVVWWDGKLWPDLITFDDAGFKLLHQAMSARQTLEPDVAGYNVKQFLNAFLVRSGHDFSTQGPIHFDEPMVKALLGIR
jgi:hypothetical protein